MTVRNGRLFNVVVKYTGQVMFRYKVAAMSVADAEQKALEYSMPRVQYINLLSARATEVKTHGTFTEVLL